MKIVQDFSAGIMDQDNALRNIEKGKFIYAENVRINDSVNHEGGVISTFKGTTQLYEEPLLMDETGRPVGTILGMQAFEDEIYYIGYGTEGTFIAKYDTLSHERTIIMVDSGEHKIFPFDRNTVIGNIHKFKDMLIFHDRNQHDPYKINIKRLLSDSQYYEDGKDVTVVKPQPLHVDIVPRFNEEYSNVLNFENNMFWFANRYIYEDGEVSAISRYSNIPVEQKREKARSIFYIVVQGTCRMVDNNYEYTLQVKYSNKDKILSVTNSGNIGGGTTRTGIAIGNVDPNSGRCLIAVSAGKDMLIFESNFNEIKLLHSASFNDYHMHSYSNYHVGQPSIKRDENYAIFSFDSMDYMNQEQKNCWLEYFQVENGKVDGLFTIPSGINTPAYICSEIVSDNNTIFLGGESLIARKYNNDDSFKNISPSSIYEWLPTGSSSFFTRSLSCSAEGNVVYAIIGGLTRSYDFNGFILIMSRDFGDTWVKIYETMEQIRSISCSHDGAVVYMALNKGVWASFGYGHHFDKLNVSGESFFSVSTYGDGGVLCVASRNSSGENKTYLSKDYGNVFEELISNNVGSSSFVSAIGYSSDLYNQINIINNHINEVDIQYNSGNKHVKKIELLMKVGGNMYVIKSIDKGAEDLEDNTKYKYTFRNSGLYKLVAAKDIVKMYDNVPLTARTSAIIQNALMFGGYTEGYDVSNLNSKLDIEILKREGVFNDVSLKTGTRQSYGIIYYDYTGRSSSVVSITDIDVDEFTVSPTQMRRTAKIKINHKAPLWASYYRIARRDPRVRFDVIKRFDNAYYYNKEIYLEITSMPWAVPKTGDKLQLLSVIGDDNNEDIGHVFVINRLEHLKNNNGVTLELSDGTHISQGKYNSPIPDGRYIVVNDVSIEGFAPADIIDKKEKWTSSIFYLFYDKIASLAEDSSVYLETPYEFSILHGLHGGDINQTDSSPAEIQLDNDGDVIIFATSSLNVEVNKFMSNDIFTTLGRPNAVSDNYKQIDRYAGLCVSEVYVDDTGHNGLSSFNLALLNYKDLEENHREIEWIDGFDTNVEVYQRDKVSVVQYKKNVLTTAAGEKQVTQSQDIFGEQQMYAADYGMDNFRTYAKSGNSRYFVDSTRGVVLRKDLNGIVPISENLLKSNLFHELKQNGARMGIWDAMHNSYILALNDTCVNFFENKKGWSSYFSLKPDIICNTNSGVYSFYRGHLYEHNSGDPGQCYDVEKDSIIEFVVNDYRDINKVFTALMFESTQPPYYVQCEANNIKTTMDSGFFKKEESLYLGYIPMGIGETAADAFLIGRVDKAFSGRNAKISDTRHVHKGDVVWIQRDGERVDNGDLEIINYSNETIYLNAPFDFREGDLIISLDTSSANGEPVRGRFMRVLAKFIGNVVIRSIQTEIDQSNV